MADMENQEDQKISECLQEAFGYSDEQLLKQLDHVNENFKDVSFAGAEERLMKRFMERKAEMERKAVEAGPETTKSGAQAGEIPEITAEAEECAPGEESKPEPLELEKKQGEKQNKKKIVRFGKKKALATAALVAVIAGMLGGTAIGKKSYFFRNGRGDRAVILLNNDKNKSEDSEIQEIYKEINETVKIPVIKLGYYPAGMTVCNYELYEDEAVIQFLYKDNYIRMIQAKCKKNNSINLESDRIQKEIVFNTWIQKDIEYSVNEIANGKKEYEVLIPYQNNFYYLSGIIEEEVFIKIIKNLNFY